MCKDSHYQTSQPSRKNSLNYFQNEVIIAFLCPAVSKEKTAAAMTVKCMILQNCTKLILLDAGLLQP